MVEIRRIEDLRVWQSAREVCREIYAFTRKDEFDKDFRFVQQIRSAAGSIMDNIAEGFGRGGNKEFLQFLTIARGSSQEVLSQLYRAYDVGYITESELDSVKQKINLTCVMIHNLIESIKKSEMKGSKYNTEPH
jgi:four helix bundle protein